MRLNLVLREIHGMDNNWKAQLDNHDDEDDYFSKRRRESQNKEVNTSSSWTNISYRQNVNSETSCKKRPIYNVEENKGPGKKLKHYKFDDDDYVDDLIMKYVRKRSLESIQADSEEPDTKQEEIQEPAQLLPKYQKTDLNRFEDEIKEEEDSLPFPTCLVSELENIKELKQLFFDEPYIEETKFLASLDTNFFQAWGEINLGESVMEKYVNFCRMDGRPMTKEYWTATNRQLRERFLNSLPAFYMLEQIPAPTLFKLFKEKLFLLEILAYMYTFNQDTVEAQMRISLGAKDMLQWEARESHIQPLSCGTLMKHMPLSESGRHYLLHVLKGTERIMANNVVFILTSVLVLCDSPDPHVAPIYQHCLTILQRFLKSFRLSNTEDLRNIQDCVKKLPNILQILSSHNIA